MAMVALLHSSYSVVAMCFAITHQPLGLHLCLVRFWERFGARMHLYTTLKPLLYSFGILSLSHLTSKTEPSAIKAMLHSLFKLMPLVLSNLSGQTRSEIRQLS